MAHDVFISYSSKDKPTADAVCASLEGSQIRCWIAPRDILSGVPFSDAIIDAINNCQVMVLVYSGNSNNSPHVLRELERAVSKEIPILPFRIEDAPLSKSMEYFIGLPHWLDAMSPPLEKHLSKLSETVIRLLASAEFESAIPAETTDKTSKIEDLIKEAESGDVNAVVNLGLAYVNGDGVPQDYEQSTMWFRKAAEMGHPMGTNNLGSAYFYGHGIEQDYNIALWWYRKACELDEPLAMGNLAFAYYNGTGVERDYDEAKKYWKMGADRGHPTSMYNYGMMLENGLGGKKDFFQAIKWYYRAARRQEPNALERLQALGYDPNAPYDTE